MAAKDVHETVRATEAMQARFEALTRPEAPRTPNATAVTCAHWCSQHQELMNPNLWSSLSQELLHLVFARLPVDSILRLRSLSHQWKKNINTGGSAFLRACEEAHPRLFGHISIADLNGQFWVREFDVKRDKWNAFKLSAASEPVEIMNACDGGLVCFVGWKSASPLSITVVNPLTQERRQLPPSLDWSDIKPSMVQIVVDRRSRHYKVVVVRKWKAAEVYHSETNQWTGGDQSLDLIVGDEYEWDRDRDEIYYCYRVGLCGYDFLLKRPVKYKDTAVWFWPNAHNFALLKDRLFVLHDAVKLLKPHAVMKPRHWIAEYRLDANSAAWQKVKTHRCGPFEDPPRMGHFMRFYACKPGFLVVVYQSLERLPYRHEPGWLYDLASETWRDLPILPGTEVCIRDQTGGFLCELHWDVQP